MPASPSVFDAVNAAIMGDRDGFQAGFNDLIASKVSDALEVKKVEVASSLLTPQGITNEPEEVETEFDGSDVDAATTDSVES